MLYLFEIPLFINRLGMGQLNVIRRVVIGSALELAAKEGNLHTLASPLH